VAAVVAVAAVAAACVWALPAAAAAEWAATPPSYRFNLTLGVNVTNILNHFNPGGYQGVITSPQFLDPTTVNTGFGGGGLGGFGGFAAANNRRIEFDAGFTF
jgi:hypothetical protein